MVLAGLVLTLFVGCASQLPPPSLAGERLAGTLTKPEGAGPFPAIVLLHGCSGIIDTEQGWAAELVKRGYVVLLVDSFGPRGYREICTDFRRVRREERVQDAYRGLGWLRTQAFVDGKRIGLMGISNGGYARLEVMRADRTETRKGFRAAVAMYPECKFNINTRFYAPLMILMGGDDDWTVPAYCRALASANADGSTPPVLLPCIRGFAMASTTLPFPFSLRASAQYQQALRLLWGYGWLR